MRRNDGFLVQDLTFLGLSLILAGVLVWLNIPAAVIQTTAGLGMVSSFVSGMFFTSVLTTAPAIVTLGEIARVDGLFETAFFGAMGAVIGDLIIFRFIRDRLSKHLLVMLREHRLARSFRAHLRKKAFRWLAFLVGGLIIASPLPDEVGISVLGLSHMDTRLFIPISFAFNFLGILLIGLLARAI